MSRALACAALLLSTACLDVAEPPDYGQISAAVDDDGPGHGGDDGPACFGSPTVTVGAVTTSSITIKIEHPCRDIDWRLERRIGSTATTIDGSGVPATHTDSGLAVGTTICYRVAQRPGTWSDAVCATTQPPPPPAPTGLTLRSDALAIEVEFQDGSTTEDHFKVFHARIGGQWELVQQLPTLDRGGTGRTYKISGLKPTHDASHCYIVGAYNAAGSTFGPERCTVYRNEGGAPDDVVEWSFEGDDDDRRIPYTRYRLRNLRSYLDLAFTPEGNWQWRDDLTTGNAFLERRTPSSFAPLVEGEPVAIHVENAGYLIRYWVAGRARVYYQATRDDSIYQWVLKRPAATSLEGTALREEPLALFNLVQNDFLGSVGRDADFEIRWAQHR